MLSQAIDFIQALDADTFIVILGLLGVPTVTARSVKKAFGAVGADKDALESIQRNVEELRMLHVGYLNLNGGGNFLADKSGDFTWVSRDWTKMTGLSESDAMGQGWILGVAENDRFDVNRAWHATVTSNGAIPFAADFTTDTGLPVRGEAVAIEGEDSTHPEEIAGFFGHIRPTGPNPNTGS